MNQTTDAHKKSVIVIGGSIQHVHIPPEAIKVYAAPFYHQPPETISFLEEKSKEYPQLGSPEEILSKILAIDAACVEPIKLKIPITSLASKHDGDYRQRVMPDKIPVPKQYSRNRYRK